MVLGCPLTDGDAPRRPGGGRAAPPFCAFGPLALLATTSLQSYIYDVAPRLVATPDARWGLQLYTSDFAFTLGLAVPRTLVSLALRPVCLARLRPVEYATPMARVLPPSGSHVRCHVSSIAHVRRRPTPVSRGSRAVGAAQGVRPRCVPARWSDARRERHVN
jgi:hypothetical protein